MGEAGGSPCLLMTLPRGTMRQASVALKSGLVALAMASAAQAAPIVVPFDFSHSEIGVDITIHGKPAYAIIDTGVDPSLIDLATAEATGIKVNRGDSGEASGFGGGKGATVFGAKIEGLAIAGEPFGAFDALAADTSGLSKAYGRKLDAVLGYSFLSDKVVLIDYPAGKLGILARLTQARPLIARCRVRWRTPLRTIESYPVIDGFRIGKARATVSLDTGANGGVALFKRALDLPGMDEALVESGSSTHVGARGAETAKTYRLRAPVGFGPFSLPAGQEVSVYGDQGAKDPRAANIGNGVLSAMRLKVLLDYRSRAMTFYGRCG
jgi:hypothetical protein